MSKRLAQLKKPLIIIAAIVGSVILLALIFSAVVLFSIFNTHGKRETISKQFSSVDLPSELHYQAQSYSGDTIDSPGDIGWVYTYSVPQAGQPLTGKSLISVLKPRLSHQGFLINNSSSDGFQAMSEAKNLDLVFEFHPGIVYVHATELH